ncbi:MAG: hypothetical protein ACNYPI_11200 [Arenicellales bacterium WSBS_2016_MAG_OTU3]
MITIKEQNVDLTQMTFGIDFKLPFAIQTGSLDLTGGLSGIYSKTNGGISSDHESYGVNFSVDMKF